METIEITTKEQSKTLVYIKVRESLLKALPAEEFEAIRYNRGEIIYREGDIPDGLHFILSGKAKVYMRSRNSKEQIIHIATVHECPGYEYLLNNTRFLSSCSAMEHVTATFIPRDIFSYLLRSNEELMSIFFSMLCKDIVGRERKMTDMAYKPVRGRLADALLDLSEIYQDFSGGISLSRSELASYIGSVRETTCRMLSELKREEVIHTKGDIIHIHNKQKLLEISNMYR